MGSRAINLMRTHSFSLGQLLLKSLDEEALGTECLLFGTSLLFTDSLKSVLEHRHVPVLFLHTPRPFPKLFTNNVSLPTAIFSHALVHNFQPIWLQVFGFLVVSYTLSFSRTDVKRTRPCVGLCLNQLTRCWFFQKAQTVTRPKNLTTTLLYCSEELTTETSEWYPDIPGGKIKGSNVKVYGRPN